MDFKAVFFFVAFLKVNDWLNKVPRCFLVLLVKNKFKVIFWVEKTKAPFFQPFFWTIIDDASSIVLVKKWGRRRVICPINLKNKNKGLHAWA